MTPQELMDATAPKVGALGGSFYFAPATLAVGKEHGLDGMRFYILGRGGVLGDVAPAVVTSAFGYFHPAAIAKLWDSAKEIVAPRTAADLYNECCADFGRQKLADVDGLAEFCDAAETLVAACPLGALSLYAGWTAQPLADDLPARAMQLIALLREQRGSAHLAAIVASGLRPEVAHAMKRPDMVSTFGWDPAPAFDDSHSALASRAEALTDDALRDIFGVLSDAQAAAYLAGVDAAAAAAAA
ncbi:MAG: hypothetical protein R2706_21375 [Acidimicrobiales bacterium]